MRVQVVRSGKARVGLTEVPTVSSVRCHQSRLIVNVTEFVVLTGPKNGRSQAPIMNSGQSKKNKRNLPTASSQNVSIAKRSHHAKVLLPWYPD